MYESELIAEKSEWLGCVYESVLIADPEELGRVYGRILIADSEGFVVCMKVYLLHTHVYESVLIAYPCV